MYASKSLLHGYFEHCSITESMLFSSFILFLPLGIFGAEDLKNYTVKERKVITMQFPDNLTLNTMSAPGGGPILAMIHNIMTGKGQSPR